MQRILRAISDDQLRWLQGEVVNPNRYNEIAEVVVKLWREVLINKCALVDGYLRSVTRTKATAFDIDAFLVRYLEAFLWSKVVEPINDNMKEWIQEHYIKYYEEGLGYEQIVQKMQLDKVMAYRALRIVRTEGTRASGAADMLSGYTAGFETKKKWLNVKDNRTRILHSHSGVGGEERELEEPYSNDMMMPGDSTAPANEVINCRCTQRLIPKRDSKGRLIRKQPLSGTEAANKLLTHNIISI